VSLITAHRILISSGIVMCIIYTLRQVLSFSSSHAMGDLIRACLALLGAIGLGLYLRSIRTYSSRPLPTRREKEGNSC
jgi:uncharacterized BrkB/YihY/UPF0761 family membrane protein